MSTDVAPAKAAGLLGPDDPAPLEIINGSSTYPVVLVCEHAGREIPQSLGNLGLSDEALQAHIAWDIGAEAVARMLADRLGASLVLQRYSRLVIDCNRPPESVGAIPTVSDNTKVPGNRNLHGPQRQQRIDEIFEPYQTAVRGQITRRSCQVALSIHSFTRTMAGLRRPWDIGFLFRNDRKTSLALADHFKTVVPIDRIGFNEPYQIDDETDWFVPKHGEANNLQHSLIEICNDLIDAPAAQRQWADHLASAISQFVQKDMS